MSATLLLTSIFLACFPHRVRVESQPPGATVQIGRRTVGVTPVDVTIVTLPHMRVDTGCNPRKLRRRRCRFHLRVSLPGYRSVDTSLGQDARWWRHLTRPFRGGAWGCILPPFQWRDGACITPHTQRSVVLVPEHGPSGTWTPKDASQ